MLLAARAPSGPPSARSVSDTNSLSSSRHDLVRRHAHTHPPTHHSTHYVAARHAACGLASQGGLWGIRLRRRVQLPLKWRHTTQHQHNTQHNSPPSTAPHCSLSVCLASPCSPPGGGACRCVRRARGRRRRPWAWRRARRGRWSASPASSRSAHCRHSVRLPALVWCGVVTCGVVCRMLCGVV